MARNTITQTGFYAIYRGNEELATIAAKNRPTAQAKAASLFGGSPSDYRALGTTNTPTIS